MTLSVIGAGLCRTGTLSLKHGLERLGVAPCYHMVEWLAHLEHSDHWHAAQDGEPVDWDAFFGDYQASVDLPGALYYRELCAQYPEAKVILTARAPDSWYESTRKTIHTASRTLLAKIESGELSHPPNSVRRLQWLEQAIWQGLFAGRFDDREHAIAIYEAHNRAVVDTVDAERLLVFEVAQGWGPLCEFLGTTPPDEPFPRTNSRAEFVANTQRRLSGELANWTGPKPGETEP